MRSPRELVACALFATCFVACTKQTPVSAKPVAKASLSDLERYLPLVNGTVFAYETASETGNDKGFLVLEIRRPRASLAEFVVAGRVRRVEIDQTGIRHATGGWLLRQPLEVGARWPGDFGTVEVRSVDRTVSVPAGSFSGCLETIEALTSSEFNKKTTTIFCPDVGVVVRMTEAETSEGYVSESMRLRSHGPRFDANNQSD